MKKVLLGLALVASSGFAGEAFAADVLRPAITAVRPAPAPTYSGEGELSIGIGNDGGSTIYTLGGAARATFWLAPTFSIQLDGNFDSWHQQNNSSWNSVGIVGHANMRNQSYLLGVYAGVLDLGWQNRVGVLGVEGQLYLGNVTLEARGNWGTEFGTGWNLAQFRGAARLFIDPNFMIEGNAGFESFTGGLNAFTVGAVVEHKYGSSPLSVFASVDYGHTSGGWNVTTGKLGVKFLYNQQTLRSADMTGSSLGKGLDFQTRLGD